MYPGGPGGTIPVALDQQGRARELLPLMHKAIDEAAANGVPNVIVLLRRAAAA